MCGPQTDSDPQKSGPSKRAPQNHQGMHHVARCEWRGTREQRREGTSTSARPPAADKAPPHESFLIQSSHKAQATSAAPITRF